MLYMVAIQGTTKTLKIFFEQSPGILNSTSLNFGDNTPNLQRTEDGSGYLARVIRRISFASAAGGLQNCLTIYKLQAYSPLYDDTLFGFIPVFGPDMAKPYLEYYIEEKERFNIDKEPNAIPFSEEVLSALIGTQDKKLICKEIRDHKRFGLSNDQLLSVVEQLNDLGFPGVNLFNCEEK